MGWLSTEELNRLVRRRGGAGHRILRSPQGPRGPPNPPPPPPQPPRRQHRPAELSLAEGDQQQGGADRGAIGQGAEQPRVAPLHPEIPEEEGGADRADAEQEDRRPLRGPGPA